MQIGHSSYDLKFRFFIFKLEGASNAQQAVFGG